MMLITRKNFILWLIVVVEANHIFAYMMQQKSLIIIKQQIHLTEPETYHKQFYSSQTYIYSTQIYIYSSQTYIYSKPQECPDRIKHLSFTSRMHWSAH